LEHDNHDGNDNDDDPRNEHKTTLWTSSYINKCFITFLMRILMHFLTFVSLPQN